MESATVYVANACLNAQRYSDNQVVFWCQGVVSVANLSFEKDIKVHYTFDNWATTQVIQCEYAQTNETSHRDLFHFNIALPTDRDTPVTIQFVVSYNGEHWDNNNGQNHVLTGSVPSRTHGGHVVVNVYKFNPITKEAFGAVLAHKATNEKTVTVRATCNGWATTQEYEADACYEGANGNFFMFKFPIKADGTKLEYAVRMRDGSVEHWDNNGGRNFTFVYGKQSDANCNAIVA